MKFDSGYPIFSVRFVDEKTIVIGGGGGEGRHGIPNKISVLKVDPVSSTLSLENEIELSSDEDSVMSLDVLPHGSVVYAGVNKSEESIKKGENEHLRIFDIKKNKQKSETTVFEMNNKQIADGVYQNCTCISGNQIAISNSKQNGQVYMLNTRSMKTKWSKDYEEEINDMQFSPSGKRLMVVKDKSVDILDSTSGKIIETIEEKEKGKIFTKARFTNDEEDFVVAFNLPKGQGAELVLYNDFNPVQSQRIKGRVKVTALDASEQYIGVGTSDLSIHIYSAQLSPRLKEFKNVHGFSITDIVFSEDEMLLASASAAHTIDVIQLPEDGKFHTYSEAFIWILISILLIIITAIIFQFLVKRQMIDALQPFYAARHAVESKIGNIESKLERAQETPEIIDHPSLFE